MPAEWSPLDEDEHWNEDDELFASAMSLILEQAYEATGADHTHEILLARIAVELGAIRQILDARLPNGSDGDPAWL